MVQKYDFSNSRLLLNSPSTYLKKVWEVDNNGNKVREIDLQPVFLGGDEKLSRILVSSIRYPVKAQVNGKQGLSLISATITKDGQMIDEKIESNLGFGLDEEALKAFKILPDTWIPANLNAQPVATRVELLLYFSLIPNGNYWTQLFHL